MTTPLPPYPVYKDSGVPWLGQVSELWSITAVKRLYAIHLAKMLQPQRGPAGDVKAPYLKAQHVQWLRVRTTGLPLMWAKPALIGQYAVAAGDLVVCEGGEGGRSGMVKGVPGPCIIQNALHCVRSLGPSQTAYLQYLMLAVSASVWLPVILREN